MAPPRDVARFYELFGWETVFLPIPYGTKKPIIDNWQDITLAQSKTLEYQRQLEAGNLGVLVGPPSANLVSIDFDSDESFKLFVQANPFLAETLQTKGSRGANLWIRIKGKYPQRVVRFDPKRSMGEWRGGKAQTVVDGRHPSGCDYRVSAYFDPLEIEFSALAWPGIFKRPDIEEDPFAKPEPILLPAWNKLSMIKSVKLQRPCQLIEGLLHCGNKMILGGGSKSFKTWTLTDLGLSLACGGYWLGFQCKKCRVLYINFELQEVFFLDRIEAICEAKQIQLFEDSFYVWTLRGYARPIEQLTKEIKDRLMDSPTHFEVIIFDPIYKTYGDRSENDSFAMAQIMNELDSLATDLPAAIIFGAHFSKGNQAAKEAIDRIGGSGVFGRDPDTIITITAHEEDDAFSLDFVLRNNPPVKKFAVRWEFPLLITDRLLDPEKIKKPLGRRAVLNAEALLEHLREYDDQLSTIGWCKTAMADLKISSATFYRLRNYLEAEKLIFRSKLGDKWNVTKT